MSHCLGYVHAINGQEHGYNNSRLRCFAADCHRPLLHIRFPALEVAVKPECSGWLSSRSCSSWSA